MKFLIKGISLFLSMMIICSMVLNLSVSAASSSAPNYGDKKVVTAGSKVDDGWVVINSDQTPVNGIYYKTILYVTGAPYGTKVGILAGTGYPENWIALRTDYQLDIQYTTIMYVEGASYGTKQKIISGTKYPDEWVVLDSSYAQDVQYSTIECVKGAQYKTRLNILSGTRRPAGWDIVGTTNTGDIYYDIIQNNNGPVSTATPIHTATPSATTAPAITPKPSATPSITPSVTPVPSATPAATDVPAVTPLATPTPVSAPITHSGIKKVSQGWYHEIILTNDNDVIGYGTAYHGELGLENLGYDQEYNRSLAPVKIPSFGKVKDIAAGGSYSLILKTDGTVWISGTTDLVDYADKKAYQEADNKKIEGLSDIVSVSTNPMEIGDINPHIMALKSDGTVWTYGVNDTCQLGTGDSNKLETVYKVPGLSNVKAIAAGGGYSVALKEDGTVWSWGGIGAVGSRTVSMVGELTGVTAIAAGRDTGVALAKDGSVWTWGYYGGSVAQPEKLQGVDGVESICIGSEQDLYILKAGAWYNIRCDDSTSVRGYYTIKLEGLENIREASFCGFRGVGVRNDESVYKLSIRQYPQLIAGEKIPLVYIGSTPTPTPTPTPKSINYGDLNDDGKVNSMDSSIFKRIILGTYEGIYDEVNADMNSDGKINSTDYSLLKRKILAMQ